MQFICRMLYFAIFYFHLIFRATSHFIPFAYAALAFLAPLDGREDKQLFHSDSTTQGTQNTSNR